MRWDIFCKVIDNFGDIGVCWRLASDLASRGQTVRLWADDASALGWMAPAGHPNVEVLPWPGNAAPTEGATLGDVVVEAFGCDLPDAIVASMQPPHRHQAPHWINLEYLSAEGYVERSHGLPSPVMVGPGAGLRKRFFFPGFTARTGGLLREPGMSGRRQAVQAAESNHMARAHALGALPTEGDRIAWQASQRVISLFCYQNARTDTLLTRLSEAWAAQQRDPGAAGTAPPWLVLVTPGLAAQEVRLALGRLGESALPGLRLHFLKPLPQADFDDLLNLSDLNFVRGEDSAVRALWAARPHVWQLYPQSDQAHAAKLHAFLGHWTAGWPEPLRQAVQQLHEGWNALGDDDSLRALPQLLEAPLWQAWQSASAASSDRQAAQTDLVTRLLAFVTQPG